MKQHKCFVNDYDCYGIPKLREFNIDGKIHTAKLCDWHNIQYQNKRYNPGNLPLK